jgi:hypothetical protein
MDDDLDLDVENDLTDEETPSPPPSGPEVDWQRETEKARKEAHGLRERLRRSEIASEYGKEVAELIPAGLPIKEWKGYAEKLNTFRGQATASDQQTTDESPAPAAKAQPSEEDRQLSQVLKGSATGSPATEKVTALQWMSLRQQDPSAADRLLRSGAVEGVTT